MTKRTIIVFGDSNTYGYIPITGSRLNKSSRWTGILSELLKDTYNLIEDGCNNRTGFYNNPDGFMQTGHLYIDQCLEQNPQPDIFIFALGSNDLQKFYNFDSKIIEDGLNNYINKIKQKNKQTRIILISPVSLTDKVLKGSFKSFFDKKSIENSKIIQEIYRKFASNNKIELFDINEFTSPSDTDGLHYDNKAHKLIAEKFANFIIKYPFSSNSDKQ